jgi:hypothetical protein
VGGLAEITEGVGFTPSFANLSAFDTGDELVLSDTGSRQPGGRVQQARQHVFAARAARTTSKNGPRGVQPGPQGLVSGDGGGDGPRAH